MKRVTLALVIFLLPAAVVLLRGTGAADVARDQLVQHHNLGKAFYENPTTQAQAVDEFRKALALAPHSAREQINYGLALLRAGKTEEGVATLEKAQKQDPAIPHTWFNLGIAYKKDAQYDRAIAQFRQMVKLAPDEPVPHYNLGVLLKLDGHADEALQEFETSERLNPNLAGPHFQLFNAYRQMGRQQDAAREQQIFQEIKKRTAGAAIPEDLEWCRFAEVYETIEPADAADDSPAPPVKLEPRNLGGGLDAATAGIAVADIDGDGRPDVIAWSSRGVQVFRGGAPGPVDCGLGALRDVVSIAPGDFDNDGLADLAVITKSGAELYVNRKGTFQKAAVQLPAGRYARAVWLDYDHDYDLDLFLLGEKSVLARNNGPAGFSDESASFPFVKGSAADAAPFDLVPDTDGNDLAVVYADRPGIIYRDRLGGHYEAQDLAVLPAGTKSIAALDINNDGWTDLLSSAAVIVNREGRLEAGQAIQPPADRPGGVAHCDLESRGLEDLVAGGATYRNQGMAKLAPSKVAGIPDAVAVAAADFDADGRTDLAVVARDGSVQVLRNATATQNAFLGATLVGVKNLKLAYGAKVEVKAGALYQKQTYRGIPLAFGMRSHKTADTVRITWPNGMVQNEVNQPAGKALAFKEAPRLSGSCPMIFTWNGQGFDFLTDVLGVAPLGASLGDGTYFPVDHDEYIQVPGERMVQRDGQYEIRITEELREVSYLDQVGLIAVDHPADIEVFTNDKFKSPPFPEFRLFAVRRRVYPVSARDDRGGDVLPRLQARDRKYPDGFARDFAGTAELHHLDLDFGHAAAANRAVLILNGWVDWADGSTFRAASQEGHGGLITPYLQVRDAAGNWRTVIEDMGMPAGKPKTIAVDLTGKFLSASREVRIVTNLCVYWDEIFLGEDAGAPAAVMTPLDAASADLRFRGFSRPVIDPQRKQPERFLYGQLSLASAWNPTPGRYTRYGDVVPLVRAADDRMVIMGSGDELRLLFDPRRLPPAAAGWKRDFLLLVDGWAKDQDANTAYARSVEPLPFHAMSAYPYTATERYPDDAAHRDYRTDYNTRPALELLRPLRN